MTEAKVNGQDSGWYFDKDGEPQFTDMQLLDDLFSRGRATNVLSHEPRNPILRDQELGSQAEQALVPSSDPVEMQPGQQFVNLAPSLA